MVHLVPSAGLPDINTIKKKGIRVNKKFIPANKHFAIGKMYLGIYTLFIKEKLPTTDVSELLVASEK